MYETINRKGRKEDMPRTQSILCALGVLSLRPLRLKPTILTLISYLL
jgi:hypothetical protein